MIQNLTLEKQVSTLIEVLKLLHQHFHHIETERYWFMSVYTAIIGVMVGFIYQVDPPISESYKIWLLLFPIVLTLIGFFINVRWLQTLDLVSSKIKEISVTLGVANEIQFEPQHNGIWKILRTRYLFLFYYVVVFTALIILFFIIK